MPRKTKQNEITSPELLNQVNPDNVRLKQDFIAYLQSVQRSPKTIAGYSNDIDIFWVWNLQNNGNKFFPKISKRDYAAYQHWLINENGNSPARVRRLKSAISSLSNYVENILDDEDEFKDFRSTVRKIENPAMQQVRKYDLSTTGDDIIREFDVDIPDEDLDEIADIVSEGMLVQWMKPYTYKQESLESVLNTKDFTTYSPAELLMRIGNAYAAARKDFTNMMREYSYNHGDLTDLHL